jgi:hypothetical protein
MQPFDIALQPEVGDEHPDGSSGQAIVRGLKVSDRFDVGIHLEYPEQHAQVRSLGLDNQGFIRRQEWHD